MYISLFIFLSLFFRVEDHAFHLSLSFSRSLWAREGTHAHTLILSLFLANFLLHTHAHTYRPSHIHTNVHMHICTNTDDIYRCQTGSQMCIGLSIAEFFVCTRSGTHTLSLSVFFSVCQSRSILRFPSLSLALSLSLSLSFSLSTSSLPAFPRARALCIFSSLTLTFSLTHTPLAHSLACALELALSQSLLLSHLRCLLLAQAHNARADPYSFTY